MLFETWLLILVVIAAVCSVGTLLAMFAESNTNAGRYETICSRLNQLDTRIVEATKTGSTARVESMVQGVGFGVADTLTLVRGIKADTRKRLYTAVVREVDENLPDQGKELVTLKENEDGTEHTSPFPDPDSTVGDTVDDTYNGKRRRSKT